MYNLSILKPYFIDSFQSVTNTLAKVDSSNLLTFLNEVSDKLEQADNFKSFFNILISNLAIAFCNSYKSEKADSYTFATFKTCVLTAIANYLNDYNNNQDSIIQALNKTITALQEKLIYLSPEFYNQEIKPAQYPSKEVAYFLTHGNLRYAYVEWRLQQNPKLSSSEFFTKFNSGFAPGQVFFVLNNYGDTNLMISDATNEIDTNIAEAKRQTDLQQLEAEQRRYYQRYPEQLPPNVNPQTGLSSPVSLGNTLPRISDNDQTDITPKSPLPKNRR
jgi:hypothetical protein